MDYLLHILILSMIFSIAALGVNFISGYTGLITLSHGAFMGLGAYGFAILLIRYEFSTPISFLLSLIICAVIAFFLSFPLLRLKDDAYVLVTFGIAFIGNNLFFNLDFLTNGALGMKGIPSYSLFSTFLIVLIILLIGFSFLHIIIVSSYGTILKAIRENLKVAQIAGHSVDQYRRTAFIISAIFAGISGMFLASFQTAIDPILFSYHTSVLILIMTILGGLASLPGAIIGAFLLTLIPELLRFAGFPGSILAESQQISYGLILILLMMYRPKGIFGKYSL